jgi:hypothetical protein
MDASTSILRATVPLRDGATGGPGGASVDR